MKYTKLKIQNQRKRIDKNIEIDKERLKNRYILLKQNETKSKEEIIKELFPEDSNNENKAIIFGQ